MHKKQGVIVLALFCILIIITAIPIALFDYNNARMINAYHTVALPSDLENAALTTAQEYDTFDRLLIAKKSAVEKTDAVVYWQQGSIPVEKELELVGIVEQQLAILQELNALPQLTLQGYYRPTIFKKTYIDMQNPNAPVNILRIQMHYLDFFLDVYMDEDTYVLYDISILSQKDDLIYVKDTMPEKGFFEYLKNASDGIEKNGEVFDAYGIYDKSTIRLFAISYNDRTKTSTYYNFEDRQYYTVVEASSAEGSDIKTKTIP